MARPLTVAEARARLRLVASRPSQAPWWSVAAATAGALATARALGPRGRATVGLLTRAYLAARRGRRRR